ncbi:MAG: MBL fold metallo-hydrolase [Propionibacteriaceae bacterium]|nr:MBL fold metallo-hydrolase [Propionibacteriaceae bacterium]
MLIASVPSQLWDENCYVLALAAPGPAVVVDPGFGVADRIASLAAEHGLQPVAVLVTHGHIDHVADAAAVADRYGVACHLHPAERRLLSKPGAGLDPLGAAFVADLLGRRRLSEPAKVELVGDRDELELAGLTWRALLAPGHRPGCLIYTVDTPKGRVAFTGDVLFAGAIGRTDLPGGSSRDMVRSLRDVVLGPPGSAPGSAVPPHLPPDSIVLPGHGPTTTMAAERRSNPYLQASFLEAA